MGKSMKIIAVLMIVAGLVLTGCSQGNATQTSSVNEEVKTEEETEKADATKEDSKEPQANATKEEGSKENDESGQEDGYISYLGKTEDEIIELMGKPTEKNYSDQGQYLTYYDKERISFYFGELNEKLIVKGFAYRGDKKILGIKNGIETKEIIEVLGVPDKADEDTEMGLYAIYYFDINGYCITCNTEGGKYGKIDFLTVISNEIDQQIEAQEEGMEQQTADYLAETTIGLRLLQYDSMEENGLLYIVGKIENLTDKDIEFVSVIFDIYDGEGNQIEEASDSINKLKAGKTWKFKASVLSEEAAKYELNDITNW